MSISIRGITMNTAIKRLLSPIWLTIILLFPEVTTIAASDQTKSRLLSDWENPPTDARLRAYWWWINGNVTKESITRDLEEMKAKGFGGALICDADGSSQDGNDRAPHGPTFFSDEWRELYKHTLREASRLGLEMSLNIQSGWNLGGPMVTKDDAPKKLVWTETKITGGTNVSVGLAVPKKRDGHYRDLFVLAFPSREIPSDRKPLKNQKQKTLEDGLRPFSAPSSLPLFAEFPSTPDEQDSDVDDVTDLSLRLSQDGTLNWDAPKGDWVVIRMGWTLNDHARVSTCSEGWDGYALDPFDSGAFIRYWDAVVEPLITDAGEHAGKSLKYLHTDSWEVEVANWTPTLREEFKKRRGYDLLPWLPVFAGKIINNRDESNRFLHDFRRTMGDLAIGNHYKIFRERSHKHGLLIHPESGGPHAVPIDAQQCLGFNDAPMSEFWAWSWRHRIGDENRFFVKQPASAAHTYGLKLVLAEGFTTIGPHWQETIWDNLKPSFDHALIEGMNLLVWHAFVCSPASEGIPGQQYFAGTHLNPLVTWWEKSKPFFDYINRCQSMLQQGLPVSDVAYYYGNHVPNFTQLRKSDPAKIGRGYDYDVVTEEIILNRMSVTNGRLVLPHGVSYRVLALPDHEAISLPVLRKLKEFSDEGAVIVGKRPLRATGLKNFVDNDKEVVRLAETLWDSNRIIADRTARQVLLDSGISPDFESSPVGIPSARIDYIHRRAGDTDIYFVTNPSTNSVIADCVFRVDGKSPELWNAVTGERSAFKDFVQRKGRIEMRLRFDPCGSWFVVFGDETRIPTQVHRLEPMKTLIELTGSWTVRFDTNWGGPAEALFDSLVSWPTRSEPEIRYFSGTATYQKMIDVSESAINNPISTFILDLGHIRELAEVRVNGKSCGITWTPPFQVNVSDAIKPGKNLIEIEVVNFWPNRLIGDETLPKEQRKTRTNIRKLTKNTKLMESGLIGPVRLLQSSR